MTNILRLDELRLEDRHEGGGTHEANKVNGLIDLVSDLKPSKVLEIGSHKGVSTEVFLLLSDHVTVIDPWQDSPKAYEEFLSRTSRYSNLSIIKGYSPQDLDQVPDQSFDLIYIDGVHSPPNVADDITVALRLIKPNGWITGHDFNMGIVSEGVRSLLGEPEKVYDDQSWIIKESNVRR